MKYSLIFSAALAAVSGMTVAQTAPTDGTGTTFTPPETCGPVGSTCTDGSASGADQVAVGDVSDDEYEDSEEYEDSDDDSDHDSDDDSDHDSDHDSGHDSDHDSDDDD